MGIHYAKIIPLLVLRIKIIDAVLVLLFYFNEKTNCSLDWSL